MATPQEDRARPQDAPAAPPATEAFSEQEKPYVTTPHGARLVERRSEPRVWPRSLNVIAGTWLFVSAFAWPHNAAVLTNTWAVGMAVALTALIAIRRERWRAFNTALSFWLLVSTMLVFEGQRPATFWNNMVVGILVLVVSLYPSRVPVR